MFQEDRNKTKCGQPGCVVLGHASSVTWDKLNIFVCFLTSYQDNSAGLLEAVNDVIRCDVIAIFKPELVFGTLTIQLGGMAHIIHLGSWKVEAGRAL